MLGGVMAGGEDGAGGRGERDLPIPSPSCGHAGMPVAAAS